MKIIVQNLQKQRGLAGKLIEEHSKPPNNQVNIFLGQEIALKSEQSSLFADAHFTSRMGYGTAIYCQEGSTNIRRVKSPVAEAVGFIVKKTTLAECMGCECISFHGYNGTPFRDIKSLVSHVEAVVAELNPELPGIFAGDFNTWTSGHLEAIKETLKRVGFTLAYSWEYPGRDFPLDHVFLRGLRLVSSESFHSAADHLGALLEVEKEQEVL